MQETDKARFHQACDQVVNMDRIRNRIGTLAEKTLHAVLKQFMEGDVENHEIRVGGFVADIANKYGIIEIQTRSFDKLRRKLECFLVTGPVTVVYPIASTKWISWIDGSTGEVTKKRKSPKTGRYYDSFHELYKIKSFLDHPNFRLCLVLLNMEEYRNLDGWSVDRKKGSSRSERIPVEFVDKITIENTLDYALLIPEGLPVPFTSKDFRKATFLSQKNAATGLNILHHLGCVNRVGKVGNQYLYEKNIGRMPG
jgi:hypothetical protein